MGRGLSYLGGQIIWIESWLEVPQCQKLIKGNGL